MSGLRYEFILGRPIPPELVFIIKHHAEPEYCDNCFVFSDGTPILLWFDFPEDQITIRPEVDQIVVQEFAKRTNLTFNFNEG